MTQITLTKGYVTEVDEADADLAALRWHVTVTKWGPYAQRSGPMVKAVRGKMTMLHRVILERAGVCLDGLVVDHINGNSLDNRRSNLRAVSNQENARNISGSRSHGKSGVLGVHFDKSRNKWMAHISAMGKIRNLGRFDTLEEAKAARLAAERHDWGIQPRRAGAHA